jgi:hypothetical protein
MMKKVGEELDRSPKRLRSIMDNHQISNTMITKTPREY